MHFCWPLIAILTWSASMADPIVIAHRGASGYLPEHTLAAKAMAYVQGADFLEQDVVLTRDGVPIILHDIHLDTVSNVAERFPDRANEDGRYLAADFNLAEISTLSVHERTDPATGERVYPARFSADVSAFRIPTLEDELAMVQALNRQFGRDVGVYVEIKKPAWHRERGLDISPRVLDTLARFGYRTRSDNVWLQCFDFAELQRVRHELNSELKLVQLIGSNQWGEAATDYAELMTPAGLARVKTTADAIGPWLALLVGSDGTPSAFFDAARAAKLPMHAFTLRADDLPPGVASFDAMLQLVFGELGLEGAFTDHPDKAVAFLQARQ